MRKSTRQRSPIPMRSLGQRSSLPRPSAPPRVKIIRRVLKLTQQEFAAQFGIPLGTLRDWEQGRKEPDQAARSYLLVIASDPGAVREALKRAHQPAPAWQ